MKKDIRIGIVPIDDRPCNLDFFKDAMKLSKQIHVDTPPVSSLGHFEQEGDFELLKDFLITNCSKWDYLILSLESLCYGGLVQARMFSDDLDMEYYFERLSITKMIKKINPKIKILASSVIIRLTPTVTEDVNLKSWEQIFEYSKLAYISLSNDSAKKKLQKLESEIDQDVLRCYLNARKRNHVINLIAIDYLKLGLFDHLSIIQEDAQSEGIHLVEQEEIQKKIDDLDLKEIIKVKNGTDEMVTLLGARIINQILGSTKVYLDSNSISENYIAKYEDRPMIYNIQSIFEEAGIELVSNYEDSDIICFILYQPEEQKDYAFETKKIIKETKKSIYQSNILNYTGNFVVLDLQHVNGGSITDLECFIEKNQLEPKNLVGYSAWNTSSNSIGTITLDCTLAHHNLSNQNYIENRIIDDALYQGDVRDRINERITELGDNIWLFKERKNNYNQILNYMMEEIIMKHPKIIVNQDKRSYHFPWNRTFEIKIGEGI